MSRLLRGGGSAASSLGSFVIGRAAPIFTPMAGERGAANDDPASPTPEDELARVESEAFALGFESGREAVEQELGAEREAIGALAQSLEALRPLPPQQLALLLAETVDRLVRQLVGEVGVDPVLLLSRAKAAAAVLGGEAAAAKMRLHPDDVPLLADAGLSVAVEADPTVERGAIRIETATGWIEDSPDIRLDRLRAGLDRMGAPR
ncbi:MAG: FliH/SctL family protein [Allosphingosinicella sp.]